MAFNAVRRSRRFSNWVAGALGMAVMLGGCSDEGGLSTPTGQDAASPESTSDPSATGSPTPGMQVIELDLSGDTMETGDESVEVRAGETIALQVTAGAAMKGAIHVHSSPEQTFKDQGGTSAFVMSIEQPGLVDVVADHSGEVIVQLKVI
ncbi:hypothetical protein AAII07_04990 [Microvirga sp. 0TCS3.31]